MTLAVIIVGLWYLCVTCMVSPEEANRDRKEEKRYRANMRAHFGSRQSHTLNK